MPVYLFQSVPLSSSCPMPEASSVKWISWAILSVALQYSKGAQVGCNRKRFGKHDALNPGTSGGGPSCILQPDDVNISSFTFSYARHTQR